ncbi:MAG: KH protein [archaeon GW2011_AR17]|nr:MAG: KH protein [archaeon GW2011_AR17]MBS3154235.1 RNA-processing protein [Candidatus Woesearchaeota archaeon]HIH14885.1 RNA-processing protein [Nanoarchaeota archaeon]HIH58857.1 RNA-processing protein [Nanoarchaeota archaeon]HII14054.1 RNA-processing protein [Nanoarchaeota archaeon]
MDSQELKIPVDRVAILIGKNGEVKKKIEKKMHVHIDIHSEEGDVIVSGEDSVAVYETLSIVKAIGRGFNPEIAELLFDENNTLELITISDFSGNSQKKLLRLRGRVIGQEGKSRKMIESLTETYISVYGKTIALIGGVEAVAMSRQAVEMLLEGAPHGNVYKWLEDKRRETIRRKFADKTFM